MIRSIARTHFPQIVWRGTEKRLWNPIHRQALKNRPEERVRLRILEYLLYGGWSKHRISIEEAIMLPQGEAPHRADMICYTRDFSPLLLIECKAENVKLSEQTADQIARYNQQLQAPFLLMSNGQRDYWYAVEENKSAQRLDDIPDALPAPAAPSPDFEYWQQRGIIGSNAGHDLRRWLQVAIKTTLHPSKSDEVSYISFKKSPTGFDLANYYCILPVNKSRLALTFTATPYGGSRLIIILNEGKQNKAVLESNLDLLFDDQAPNASIYWQEGPRNVDLNASIPELINHPFRPEKQASAFCRLIKKIID